MYQVPILMKLNNFYTSSNFILKILKNFILVTIEIWVLKKFLHSSTTTHTNKTSTMNYTNSKSTIPTSIMDLPFDPHLEVSNVKKQQKIDFYLRNSGYSGMKKTSWKVLNFLNFFFPKVKGCFRFIFLKKIKF